MAIAFIVGVFLGLFGLFGTSLFVAAGRDAR